jgi:hypothetical protein
LHFHVMGVSAASFALRRRNGDTVVADATFRFVGVRRTCNNAPVGTGRSDAEAVFGVR